jgi:hypothetical protein
VSRQPLDRNIEGLRGEVQHLSQLLVSFKQMVHEVSETNRRTATTMVRLTWATLMLAAMTLILAVVLAVLGATT